MVNAWVAGSIFFPGLFLVSKKCLRLLLVQWQEADAVIVSARLVSSVQAILASAAGYVVATSCRDIINDQHWLTATYTQFAVPYFIYDIFAMFLCHWYKYKVKGHEGQSCNVLAITRCFLYKEFLMVVHHVFMVVVCFPMSVFWRQGKGDFFLGCMLMAELSTPFVCLGKILIQYKKQHTLLHKVNGLLMLITFFICRILLFPYMYWVYGQRVGLALHQVPFSIPPEYTMGSAVLMAPQIYWFSLICRGAYKLFRRPWAKDNQQAVKNGHTMDSHQDQVQGPEPID
uniref:Ceramide synthase n=1 Tax=Geotrypetes seraphini TaxID=260995 RepID=A0A6P8QYD1_GEOSA|nr:ceramide synthase [Geotrypetes seraphini]